MTAHDDPIAAMFREQATAALADALAPLVQLLAVLDEPRPGVWKPSEAAVVLGVNESTVRRWVKEGELDRLPGVDKVLIPRISVERFLDATTRPKDSAKRARRVA